MNQKICCNERRKGTGITVVMIFVISLFFLLGYSVATGAAEQKQQTTYGWYYPDVQGSKLAVPYSAFREQVEQGNVKEIRVTGEEITGRFIKPVKVGTMYGEQLVQSDFMTYLPSFGDSRLSALLAQRRVIVETVPTKGHFLSNLSSFLPWVMMLVFGLFMVASRAPGGGQLQPVKKDNAAHLYEKGENRTTFDDVAGIYAAKGELQEIVEFLKNPERFQRLGGKAPKGALLVGPPGTGKTLLARAVAGEANVPFFRTSGSDFMEVYVGVGAARVRNMFEEAKKSAPCIIFIDEIDAIGRHRGQGHDGGNAEREQTLNQLLSEMDGFDTQTKVIVMAATNRPDILDPALLRPGRFDRHITVDLPTVEDRLEILKIHAGNKPFDKSIVLRDIARGTPGFSGAELANLLNEAAIIAARKDKTAIEERDLQEARDKVIMGLERKSLSITDRERKLLAYHEGGHAVLASLLPEADPVYKVTIIPRGRAMGVTQQLPQEEKVIYPRDYILDRLAVMLGGRAAEELVFDNATSGAESDLKQATDLARRMVLDWGMGEDLRNLALGGHQPGSIQEFGGRPEYSEQTASKIDEEVRKILEGAFSRASETLRTHRPALDRLAEVLMEKEEIPGSEVDLLVRLA